MMKQYLTKLGIADGARHLTFKSWRAGRATEMAREGINLGEILRAGGWRSSAFLRYLDEDQILVGKISPCKMLQTTLDREDPSER